MNTKTGNIRTSKATKAETADQIVRNLPKPIKDAVNAMRRTNTVRRASRREKTYVRYERVGSVR